MVLVVPIHRDTALATLSASCLCYWATRAEVKTCENFRLHFPTVARLDENLPTNMKIPVTDEAVNEYVNRIRAGGPLGKVFPAKLSECDFTSIQREKIRKARADKRAANKSDSSTFITSAVNAKRGPSPKTKPITPKGLTKLKKILYLQGGNCFFCGKPLPEGEASVEHLNPKSRGGTITEDNEVVCHKTLNEVFGNMDLKRKFEFVIKAMGAFRCPGT
jgi:hypothetical protein